MEYAETRGATGGVPQEERVPKVYLTVPTEPYVREVAKRDGTTFNEVKVPAHAEIGGKPLGNGWVFNPLFVDESRYSSAMSVIPLLADRDVRLHRDVLLYDRRENRLKPALDPDGRRLQERIEVSPQALEEAIVQALTTVPERGDEARGRGERPEPARRESLSAQRAAAVGAEGSREAARPQTAPAAFRGMST